MHLLYRCIFFLWIYREKICFCFGSAYKPNNEQENVIVVKHIDIQYIRNIPVNCLFLLYTSIFMLKGLRKNHQEKLVNSSRGFSKRSSSFFYFP